MDIAEDELSAKVGETWDDCMGNATLGIHLRYWS